MIHAEFLEQPVDELLELIWCRRERGDDSLSGLLADTTESSSRETLDRLAAEGMVCLEGDRIALAPAGEERAALVVRRHRLAERLLSDVLDLAPQETEQQACLMEHILSPAVTDSVCALLGHPPTCPHGMTIPRGRCCEAKRNGSVKPVVIPLDELEPGGEAKIVFVATGARKRVEHLGSYGVIPGTTLALRQKRPSFVVELGGTSLALEKEVASEIFVRRVSP